MNEDVMKLHAVLERIKGTSSRIEKEAIVAEFKDDEFIRHCFNFLFNDFITTGLDKKKINKKIDGLHTVRGFSTLTDFLDFIAQYNTGTDQIVLVVKAFIDENTSNEDEVKFMEEVVSKTYRAGITARTVNRGFGEKFIPEFNVQLAHPYEKYADRVQGKFAITTKLDGNRILAIVDGDGDAKFFTRKGKPIEGLYEIAEDLKELANKKILNRADYNSGFVLDGEILIKDDLNSGDKFAETMKIVRKNGDKSGLVFWAFDILPLDEFHNGESTATYLKRDIVLESIFDFAHITTLNGTVKRVNPLYIGEDASVIVTYLQEQVDLGEEGIMINLDTTYKCKRHPGLLKVKEFKSADVNVLDVFPGQGALSGTLGGVVIDWKGYNVRVGSGFTFEERDYYWENQDEIIGRIIEIQFFEESTNQKDDSISLRFPTFKNIRTDKTIEDVNYE